MSLPSVGIVGTPDHVRLLTPILKSEGFFVKAVWCKNHETARQLADQFSIAHCTASFQDLLVLHDVDMVYVATDPVMQAEVAVKALTSGKHCICMKPPSVSAHESEKMLRLAQYYSQLQCLLECHTRYVPVFVKLRQLILAGDIGDLLSIDVQVHTDALYRGEGYSWKCDSSVGGGVLNLIGSHIIEVLCYLERQPCPIRRVHCCLKTLHSKTKNMSSFRTIESDDFCSLELDTASGVHTSIMMNSNCGHMYSFVFNVCGSRGRATVRGTDLYLQQEGEKEDKLVHKDSQSSLMECSEQWRHTKVLGCTGMIQALRHHFLTNLHSQEESRNGKSELASFEDGHHIRMVLDCARLSSKLGRWVSIPELGSSSTEIPFWTSGNSKTDVEKATSKSMFPVTTV